MKEFYHRIGKKYELVWADEFNYSEKPNPKIDQKFHLKLNIGIGGDLDGRKGIDDSVFPQQMVVDYVRVYQEVEQSAGQLVVLRRLQRLRESEASLVQSLAYNHAINAALAHTPESFDVIKR